MRNDRHTMGILIAGRITRSVSLTGCRWKYLFVKGRVKADSRQKAQNKRFCGAIGQNRALLRRLLPKISQHAGATTPTPLHLIAHLQDRKQLTEKSFSVPAPKPRTTTDGITRINERERRMTNSIPIRVIGVICGKSHFRKTRR